jgi:tetratricopeptide (TPR) repeat protein
MLRRAGVGFVLAWSAANGLGAALAGALTAAEPTGGTTLLATVGVFAVLGACQWAALPDRTTWGLWWTPATLLGGLAGLAGLMVLLTAALFVPALGGGLDVDWDELPPGVVGAAAWLVAAGPTVAQWLVLRRRTPRASAWLVLGLLAGAAAGVLVGVDHPSADLAPNDPVRDAVDGGLLGALAGLLSAPVLAWTLRRPTTIDDAGPAGPDGARPAPGWRRPGAGTRLAGGTVLCGCLLLAAAATLSAARVVAPGPTLDDEETAFDHAALEQASPPGAALYERAIRHLERGTYREGEAAIRRALAIQERALGPTDPAVADSVNMLGLLLAHQNRVADARRAYRRALAIWETAPGGPRVERGHAHANLGNSYQSEGHLRRAEQEYATAVAIWEAAGWRGERPLANVLSNLASVYDATGRDREADEADERARSLKERLGGPTDDDVAFTVFNEAARRLDRCDLSGAERRFERAAAIWLSSRGPEHELTARALGALAMLRSERGEPTAFPDESRRARAFLDGLLTEQLRVFGPHDGRVASTYAALGQLALADGDLEVAERAYRGAAEAYRHGARVIGGDPTVSQDGPFLARHALVLRRLGRDEEARAVERAGGGSAPRATCPGEPDDAFVTA